jgi:hypothetical protein
VSITFTIEENNFQRQKRNKAELKDVNPELSVSALSPSPVAPSTETAGTPQ